MKRGQAISLRRDLYDARIEERNCLACNAPLTDKAGAFCARHQGGYCRVEVLPAIGFAESTCDALMMFTPGKIRCNELQPSPIHGECVRDDGTVGCPENEGAGCEHHHHPFEKKMQPDDPLLSEMYPRVRLALRQTFDLTGALDLYEGRVLEYLSVIRTTMAGKAERIDTLELRIAFAAEALSGKAVKR